MVLILIWRAILALCLLYLPSCTSSKCREWDLQEIITKCSHYNGGRIILGPDSDCSFLELEIMRNSSGVRIFINILLMQAPPLNGNSYLTTATVQFGDEEPWIVHPYLLEGGQRLLLPGDASDLLISQLLDDQSFTIKIGRSYITVIPDGFTENFKRLLDIPMVE